MELKTAIEILDYHQEWRLGKREDMIHEPKKLTEAIDIVLSEVKKLTIQDVSCADEQLTKILFEVYEKGFENRCCSFTDYVKKVKKALSLADVVGRSEQLKAFENWAKENSKEYNRIAYWIAEW